MKKGMWLVIAVMLFSITGAGYAQEDALGVDVDVTWVSKYIWRGFDLMDDKAAFQPSINMDLGSGFSFNIWASLPGSSGGGGFSTVNAEEWDYTLTYSNSTYDGEAYKIDYAISWIYYDFPDNGSEDVDAQEFNLALSWPDICPSGVVPSYTIARIWAAQGGGAAAGLGGYFHIFGLGYDVAVAELAQPLSFNVDLTYNDGAGLGGGAAAHDWSHITWGVSTSFDYGPGTFTPALYYQTSMDDSINTEDEFWVGLSYGFSY